jgi:Fe-S oxidoreductase
MKIDPAGGVGIASVMLAEIIARDCTECGKCSRSCLYLQQNGLPGKQAAAVLTDDFDPNQSFLCSLCGLCTAVCPEKIDPAGLFFFLRQQAVSEGIGNFSQHRLLTNYEHRGSSSLFSWYGLPEHCTTVFFPGCALPGSRPERVVDLYHALANHFPALGIVLDCCTKPSHDLGRKHFFRKQFTSLCARLTDKGITKVVVACPNCYRMFVTYGQGLEVVTPYEVLAKTLSFAEQLTGKVTVHDPCGLRDKDHIQEAVRELIRKSGLTLIEMKHSRKTTFCCGEGGGVGYINKELAGNWGALRKQEAEGKKIIVYCAGCAAYLGRLTPTIHLLDLLFEPDNALSGRVKISGSPFTYLNRILLKKRLRKVLFGNKLR